MGRPRRTLNDPDALDGAESVALPGMESPDRFRIPPGPVERGVSRSVARAVKAGRLDVDDHAGAIALLRRQACAVDRLMPSQTSVRTAYELATGTLASRELAAQLVALGLTPDSGADVDPLDAMLAGIGGLTTTT